MSEERRFTHGERIRTTQNAGRDDWQNANRSECKWGVEGVVLKVSDAHGLCYKILHENNTEVWYDHDEVERAGQTDGCDDTVAP